MFLSTEVMKDEDLVEGSMLIPFGFLDNCVGMLQYHEFVLYETVWEVVSPSHTKYFIL